VIRPFSLISTDTTLPSLSCSCCRFIVLQNTGVHSLARYEQIRCKASLISALLLEAAVLPHCRRLAWRAFCIRRHDGSDDMQSGLSGQAFAGGVTEPDQRRPHFTLRDARRTLAQQSLGAAEETLHPRGPAKEASMIEGTQQIATLRGKRNPCLVGIYSG